MFYSEEVIREFKKGLYFLKMAALYAQRIDWLKSGDDGEDTFLSRLGEGIEKIDQEFKLEETCD